jgi:hypothetical protein
MSQFAFLTAEWPLVAEAAVKAAATIHSDPRAACFYARRALELGGFSFHPPISRARHQPSGDHRERGE